MACFHADAAAIYMREEPKISTPSLPERKIYYSRLFESAKDS